MKFKLDENFGARAIGIFRQGGYDVDTVRAENLAGCADRELFAVCARESRCLVTLDRDFADVIRYPPDRSPGIAVIRLPKNPSLPLLEKLVATLLDALKSERLEGMLWIVEASRIRVHGQPRE